MYAKVIIEYSIKKLDKEFIYMIPNELLDVLKVGMKVIVPFGYQEVIGFVTDILDSTPDISYEIKYISSIADEKLVLNKELMDLGKYLSENTLCTLITAYQTMLPSSLKVKKQKSNYDLFDEYIFIKDKNKALEYKEMYQNKRKSQIKIIDELLENGKALKKIIVYH